MYRVMVEPASSEATNEVGTPSPHGARLRGAQWAKAHRYPIALALVFTVAGGVLGPVVFPDISVVRSVLGGALFGGFLMLCAAMQRVFE